MKGFICSAYALYRATSCGTTRAVQHADAVQSTRYKRTTVSTTALYRASSSRGGYPDSTQIPACSNPNHLRSQLSLPQIN
eukprot:2085483-Rhodomonas_salina.1